MIQFICVWTGTKYGSEYPIALQRGIERHCRRPFELVCLTDQTEQLPGLRMVRIDHFQLSGWWAKMLLLDPWVRGRGRSIFLDLDTVIVGDLDPLIDVPVRGVGICANFTRAATGRGPCRYGSCVMVLEDGWGTESWIHFWKHRQSVMSICGNLGDQMAMERVWHIQGVEPTILQTMLPEGYMVGRRDLSPSGPPDGSSLIILAGPHKPHNSPYRWVREAWRS